MDLDPELGCLLGPTATVTERVEGLVMMGVPLATIAQATRSSVSTLRNWTSGQTQPRPDAAIALDDLRMIARALLEGLEPERAAAWLSSRDPERFEGARPFEIIPIDPMDVLAAASEAVIDAQSTGTVVAIGNQPKKQSARHRKLPASRAVSGKLGGSNAAAAKLAGGKLSGTQKGGRQRAKTP